jgi:ribosomal protein L37E
MWREIDRLAAKAQHAKTVLRYRRLVRSLQRQQVSANVSVDHAGAREYWQKHFGVRISTRWHDIYAQVNGIDDARYVPEDVFYADMKPVLGTLSLGLAWTDKNYYDRWIPTEVLPETILRCIHGRTYDSEYTQTKPGDGLNEEERYFIKPSLTSGGGKQVEVLSIKAGVPTVSGRPFTWEELSTSYENNFIVQRALQQHPDIAAIHPASINTLRIMTIRLNEPKVVSTCLRCGRGGSHVDNQTLGGVACGVGKDGRLNSYAIDANANRTMVHADTGFRFGGQAVPGIHEAWDLVCNLHRRLLYYDLASWDVTIDPQGRPSLVEVNLHWQEINFHQFNNGPLFGDMTEEVLHYVRNHRARN